MRRMRTAALIVTLALGGGTGNDRALDLLKDWVRLVHQHAAGEEDYALTQIGEWSADDLDLLRPYVEVFAGVPADTEERRIRRRRLTAGETAVIRTLEKNEVRVPRDEFRKRAAMLHTDAALLESMPLRIENLPATSRSGRVESPHAIDVKSSDGRVDHFSFANPHWLFAMDLLDALPAQPRRDPIVAQWYRAIGASYAQKDDVADAMRLFARAARVVPDDPGVLFGEACLQETLGSPNVQNFARVTALPAGYALMGVSRPETHFRNAEGLLKRALAVQPDFVEARLRLGRVLAGQRQHEAALTQFAQVIAGTTDPVLTYYANLFTGDAALALGRPSESRAAYERALTSHPAAQAARIGLATALRAGGDRAGAVDAVMATLRLPPDARNLNHDPWWAYYKGDAANVERLLDELRKPFTRP